MNRASDYPVHRVNQASDYPVHTPVRIDEGPSEFLIRKLLQFNRSKQIEMSDTDVYYLGLIHWLFIYTVIDYSHVI